MYGFSNKHDFIWMLESCSSPPSVPDKIDLGYVKIRRTLLKHHGCIQSIES